MVIGEPLKDTRPILVSVTFPDLPSARRAANILLEKKLAACINLFPVESHYLWQGKKEKVKEVMLSAKTTRELYPRLEKVVLKNHPYETPCLEVTSLKLNQACEGWLLEELK